MTQQVERSLFGARIEFYESLDGNGTPVGELIGAALKADAFVDVTGIVAGTRISTRSLAGGTSQVQRLCDAGMDVPYTRVAQVEHHLVPLGADGGVAPWWEGSPHPTTTLVFHAHAIADFDGSTQLVQFLTTHGWIVEPELVKFADRRDR